MILRNEFSVNIWIWFFCIQSVLSDSIFLKTDESYSECTSQPIFQTHICVKVLLRPISYTENVFCTFVILPLKVSTACWHLQYKYPMMSCVGETYGLLIQPPVQTKHG